VQRLPLPGGLRHRIVPADLRYRTNNNLILRE